MKRPLDPEKIVQLLLAEVENVGSQQAWAKRAGLERTAVNKVLKRPAAASVRRAVKRKRA
jgi:hypothetical protein